MTRKTLLKIINDSDTIKKSISNYNRNQLIETITILPNDKLIKLCSILEKNNKINFDSFGRKAEKGLMVAAVLPIPASAGLYVIYKLITKLNYQCLYKCNMIKEDLDKKLCYKKCEIASLEKAINAVKKELSDCWYHKNPKKCRKTTITYLQNLYEKLGKAKIKLNNYQYEVQIKKRNKAKKLKKKLDKIKKKELLK
jgi:hypothetical protein